jgi:Ca2+/H+ antiporter
MNLKIIGIAFIVSLMLFVMSAASTILLLNKVSAKAIFNKNNNINIQGGKNIGTILSTLFGNPTSSSPPTSESTENYAPHHHK